MQTAFHILSLVAELKQALVGGTVTGVEFYRKERAFLLFARRDRSHLAIYYSFHPTSFGSYLASASKVLPDTREKPRAVFDLVGFEVTGADQIGFDRIVRVELEREGIPRTVLYEVLGPNGNVWLLDAEGGRLEALRKREFTIGERYRPPALPDKLAPAELTIDSVTEALSRAEENSMSANIFLERHVLGFDSLLARETAHRAGVEYVDVNETDSLHRLIQETGTMVERFSKPHTGYLYRGPRCVCYPFKLTGIDVQPEKYKTLSLAVQAMTRLRRTSVEAADEEKQIIDAVKRAVKRLERRLSKIEQDIEHAADYDRYRREGELLQINFDKISKGASEITVEDVYSDSRQPLTIALDPAMSAADNVEACFRKYRKARDGLELLQRRLEVSKQELALLQTIQSELSADFDSARQKYEQEIAPLLPGEVRRGEDRPARLPYREYTLSTGLRVYVGRGGADNDRTTFEFARPYELWFHTQQCAGSHVVIKYPNKSFEPSKREIEEAASLAAYHSKAKNEALVPVIYAQRKYVRKPRKAKPGLVTVEREKSVMVEPGEPKAG